jgi:acyl-homoserine-lactone acylase
VAGDAYIAAVEFGATARAQVLLTYGNASQPGSPHIGDQLPLAATGQLRPAWRTRAAILAHLETRELVPPFAPPARPGAARVATPRD